MKSFLLARMFIVFALLLPAPGRPETLRVPILLYHRLGPAVTDSMTVTTSVFESQLRYLQEHDYRVIPLRQLVEYRLGKRPSIPPRSVGVAVDDAHGSVYTDMLPLLKKYRLPITLFVYPSAISRASYAMTWGQLREAAATGWVDIESHTFWHPNFKTDKKKLSSADYEAGVQTQLKKSKEVLEKELNIKVDLLAWPFGIYDEELIQRARGAGYVAAFSIERRPVGVSDNVMALPRYIINDIDRGKSFGRILEGSVRGG